ncbi:Meiosis-specific transcription factor NDT80 [Spathaspora sp. JA1]|nr:Meiosis-specific transcription factor NDT80 [Spathaspora sp. JA1]
MSLQFRSSPLRKTSNSRKYLLEDKSDPIVPTTTKNNNSKIAPRSGLQFKVGPPFGETIQVSSVFSTINKQSLTPVISARIDRGFDQIEKEWIGYKRNYFSVVAAFQFRNHNKSLFEKGGFFTEIDNKRRDIKSFAIRLVSKCLEDEDDSDVPLVQHTAKRDRGPQIEPPIVPVIPGILPSHIVIKESANIRKVARIIQFDRLFYDDRNTTKPMNKNSILHTYPPGHLTKVAKYERIQFASSVQYRKPICGNKTFLLQVQLLSELSENTYAIVAISETPPLTVRGRSPSNYTLTKISSNQLSNSRIKTVPSSPVFKRSVAKENYENLNLNLYNNPENTYDYQYFDNPGFKSRYEGNTKDIFSKQVNSHVENNSHIENEIFIKQEDIPQLMEIPHFLKMTANSGESSNEITNKTYTNHEYASFSKEFEAIFNQPHERYYKTYIDELEEENPTISPSLLFTISE